MKQIKQEAQGLKLVATDPHMHTQTHSNTHTVV